MSKGSTRRPTAVPKATADANYERTFRHTVTPEGRRAFLRRSAIALVGGLLLGDAALDAFERLTHRKVWALGGPPKRPAYTASIDFVYRRAVADRRTGLMTWEFEYGAPKRLLTGSFFPLEPARGCA